MPKCADCKHNFVKEGQILCNSCAPKQCRECKKFVHSINNTGLCYGCRLGATWKAHTDVGKCYECSRIKSLNAEGLCRNCYLDLIPREKKICLECDTSFESNNPIAILCKACCPKCRGCGKSFNPTDRLDKLCGLCYAQANRVDECASCGSTADLDANAHCYACSEEHYSVVDSYVESQKCELCVINEKVPYSDICIPCIEARIPCPDCGAAMPKKNYLCKKCMEKRIKLQYGAVKA